MASPSAINGIAPKKNVTTPKSMLKRTGAYGFAVKAIVNMAIPKTNILKKIKNILRPARTRSMLIRPLIMKSFLTKAEPSNARINANIHVIPPIT